MSRLGGVALTGITTKGAASAVCARTKPRYLPVSPSGAKKKYRPTAVMTPGTTTGDSTTASTSGLNLLLHCARPSAASVPSTMDSSVEATPMIMLFFSDIIQRGELMKSSYQRRERPRSAEVREGPTL